MTTLFVFPLAALITMAAMTAIWGAWWLSFRYRMPAPTRREAGRHPAVAKSPRPGGYRLLVFVGVIFVAGILFWRFAERSPDLQGQNLAGESLQNQNFANDNLAGVNFSNARLQGADLIAANLSHADLAGAQLEGADLSHADMEYADLTGAHLENADLDGANFYGAKLVDSELENADLDGTHFDSADLSGAQVAQDQLDRACGAYARLDYGLGLSSC